MSELFIMGAPTLFVNVEGDPGDCVWTVTSRISSHFLLLTICLIYLLLSYYQLEM